MTQSSINLTQDSLDHVQQLMSQQEQYQEHLKDQNKARRACFNMLKGGCFESSEEQSSEDSEMDQLLQAQHVKRPKRP
jgi:hypothetical protein